MKKFKIVLLVFLCITIVGGAGIGIYLTDYYQADEAALEVLGSSSSVMMEELDSGDVVLVPNKKDITAGMIFYPGGKVECSAYVPLLYQYAEQGILCVLVEMPGNLAVLDMHAADDIPKQFPEIENWYLAGHSLGGSMAAACAASHQDFYKGLLLLASYSTEDVSQSGLQIYSIYGSEDGVLNRQNYQQYKSNLPSNIVEYIIEGGNHAQFGFYGVQEGDGEAQISAEEQIAKTVNNSMNLFLTQEGP